MYLLGSSIPGYYAMTAPNSCPLLPSWLALSLNVVGLHTDTPTKWCVVRELGIPISVRGFQTRLEGRDCGGIAEGQGI